MTTQNKRQRTSNCPHDAKAGINHNRAHARIGTVRPRFIPLYKSRELRDALMQDYAAFVALAPADVAKYDVHPWFAARAARSGDTALSSMVEELGRIATLQEGQWPDIAKCFELAQALTGMEVAYATQRS